MTAMSGITPDLIGQLSVEPWFPAVAVSLALGLVFCVSAVAIFFVKRKWLQVSAILLICLVSGAGLVWSMRTTRSQGEDMESLTKLMSDYMLLLKKTSSNELNLSPDMMQECMQLISGLDLGNESDVSSGMSALLTNLTATLSGDLPAEPPPPTAPSTNASM